MPWPTPDVIPDSAGMLSPLRNATQIGQMLAEFLNPLATAAPLEVQISWSTFLPCLHFSPLLSAPTWNISRHPTTSCISLHCVFSKGKKNNKFCPQPPSLCFFSRLSNLTIKHPPWIQQREFLAPLAPWAPWPHYPGSIPFPKLIRVQLKSDNNPSLAITQQRLILILPLTALNSSSNKSKFNPSCKFESP
jgi:hypothetical protein